MVYQSYDWFTVVSHLHFIFSNTVSSQSPKLTDTASLDHSWQSPLSSGTMQGQPQSGPVVLADGRRRPAMEKLDLVRKWSINTYKVIFATSTYCLSFFSNSHSLILNLAFSHPYLLSTFLLSQSGSHFAGRLPLFSWHRTTHTHTQLFIARVGLVSYLWSHLSIIPQCAVNVYFWLPCFIVRSQKNKTKGLL